MRGWQIKLYDSLTVSAIPKRSCDVVGPSILKEALYQVCSTFTLPGDSYLERTSSRHVHDLLGTVTGLQLASSSGMIPLLTC